MPPVPESVGACAAEPLPFAACAPPHPPMSELPIHDQQVHLSRAAVAAAAARVTLSFAFGESPQARDRQPGINSYVGAEINIGIANKP